MLVRLTATLAIVLSASLATAQGMFDQFVKPVTWQEMKDRLVLISPSAAQMDRIAEAHDAYLAEFEALHSSDIAEFLEETKGLGPLAADDPDAGRRATARAAAIRRDIERIDEAFYDQIKLLLGEGQHAGLDRIRKRRERDRLRTRANPLVNDTRAPAHEPGDAVPWAELSEGERDRLGPQIAQWENRYTRLMDGWASASDRSQTAFNEAVAQLNARQKDFSPEAPPSPEEISELMSIFREAQTNVHQQVQPHVGKLRSHLVTGIRELAVMMPSPYDFEFVQEATGGAHLRNAVSAFVTSARRQGVDTGTIETLERARTDWQAQAIPLMIEMLEASWKDERAMLAAMTEVTDEGGISIDIPTPEFAEAVRTRWNDRHDETLEQMRGLLPAEVADAMRESIDEHSSQNPSSETRTTTAVVVSGGSDDGDVDGAVVVNTTVSSSDEGPAGEFDHLLTIPRIRTQVVDGIARDLELSASDREALQALHAEHEAARLAMETTRADARRAERKRLRQSISEGGEPTQMAMMEIAMAMMQPISREGLEALDAAFFGGAAQLTDAPERLDVWRQARVRELATGGSGMMMAGLQTIGVPDDRWKVDLFTMVHDSDLSHDDRAAALAAMEPWHDAATAALLDIRGAERRLEEAMHAMMNTSADTGKVEVDVQAAMQVDQLNAEVQRDRLKLSELTQATLDEIASTVDDGHTLRRVWVSAAFPDIAGQDAFMTLYARAANLDELTDDQRAAIAILRAEHDDAWWTTTEEAVAMLAEDRDPPANQQEAFFEGQRIRQEIDRRTFSRREAALKRIEQLRTLLSQQQLAAADGLADPPEPQTLAMPF
ncbi:MAG: hypothetical protein QF733_03170 [Phycisphaerales bacterium]|jgi:hypothetical protein|nr:hypothetical protein [Phycisphaerales bacterium]